MLLEMAAKLCLVLLSIVLSGGFVLASSGCSPMGESGSNVTGSLMPTLTEVAALMTAAAELSLVSVIVVLMRVLLLALRNAIELISKACNSLGSASRSANWHHPAYLLVRIEGLHHLVLRGISYRGEQLLIRESPPGNLIQSKKWKRYTYHLGNHRMAAVE